MKDNLISIWEAGNEAEMLNALDVIYEMATGYVLAELRDENPDVYEKLTSQTRYKSQLINNVRFSVDSMLTEVIKEYREGMQEDWSGK
ncbi:hypothetical protein GCM10028808_49940 [Spirosoma migulaei]